jgi:hypothetical protein
LSISLSEPEKKQRESADAQGNTESTAKNSFSKVRRLTYFKLGRKEEKRYRNKLYL